jgi:hypothetical protein
VCDLETSRMGAPYIYDISRLRVKMVLFLRIFTSQPVKVTECFITHLFAKTNRNLCGCKQLLRKSSLNEYFDL